jgi:hypothetical protein
VTICPCCGFKFIGTLSNGCENCGACPVGEALPKPQHELPSYGRSLVLAVSGSLVVLVFISQTVIALFQHKPRSFGFWSWAAAGETASWRLKWVAMPVMLGLLWIGLKIYRSILRSPERFCGVKYARRGMFASALVSLLMVGLIAITVPARLRQRQMSIDAGIQAPYLAFDLACFEYKQRFGRLPDTSTLKEDLSSVPDPDGSIAAALRDLDLSGYTPRADVASLPTKQKSLALRGVAIRKVSLNSSTDDTQSGGLSYTNYELRLPGEDKILGTDDDWVGRDGVIVRAKDLAQGAASRKASTSAGKP